jgi:hypothetical protein
LILKLLFKRELPVVAQTVQYNFTNRVAITVVVFSVVVNSAVRKPVVKKTVAKTKSVVVEAIVVKGTNVIDSTISLDGLFVYQCVPTWQLAVTAAVPSAVTVVATIVVFLLKPHNLFCHLLISILIPSLLREDQMSACCCSTAKRSSQGQNVIKLFFAAAYNFE